VNRKITLSYFSFRILVYFYNYDGTHEYDLEQHGLYCANNTGTFSLYEITGKTYFLCEKIHGSKTQKMDAPKQKDVNPWRHEQIVAPKIYGFGRFSLYP